MAVHTHKLIVIITHFKVFFSIYVGAHHNKSDHTFNAHAKQLLEFAQQITLSSSIANVPVVYNMQVKCIPLDITSHHFPLFSAVQKTKCCVKPVKSTGKTNTMLDRVMSHLHNASTLVQFAHHTSTQRVIKC